MNLTTCGVFHLGMRSRYPADVCSLVFEENITHDLLSVTSW
jgi:hypothetical protein